MNDIVFFKKCNTFTALQIYIQSFIRLLCKK